MTAVELLSNLKTGSKENPSRTELASFWDRALARIIDTLIFFILVTISSVCISFLLARLDSKGNMSYLETSFVVGQEIIDKSSASQNFNEFFNTLNKVTENYEKCELSNLPKSVCEQGKRYQVLLTFWQTITSLILFILYFVYIPVSRFGVTPGKKIINLKIISDLSDKSDLSFYQMFTREIFWILSIVVQIFSLWMSVLGIVYILLLFLFLVSSFKVFFSKSRTAMHDDLAKTKVIKLKSNY